MDHNLPTLFAQTVCRKTGATSMQVTSSLQTLWSGYGQLLRASLQGAPISSAILKHIVLPAQAGHPRGWNTSRSHQRKQRSYEIEMAWYQRWSQRCTEACRVPDFYAAVELDTQRLLVLEDLDQSGFTKRRHSLKPEEVPLCLDWLAHFHATFLNEEPEALWPIGTYWHLDTRPDELAAMDDAMLQRAAPIIDRMLNECRYQSLVHGDAKVANFCFSSDMQSVAAVDFQYVGGGCGMKDVIYLLGSCMTEEECELWGASLLDGYFNTLQQAAKENGKADVVDMVALETEWRALFPVAWADFTRFLVGWMPGHRKLNGYSERLTQQVLQSLPSIEE